MKEARHVKKGPEEARLGRCKREGKDDEVSRGGGEQADERLES